MDDPESSSSVKSSDQTQQIVLAKFETVASQDISPNRNSDQMGEQVLGYLEVQPSELSVDQENGTIFTQEIEIDGQHLYLTQGEGGDEIIVVMRSPTDQDNPSEQTIAHFSQSVVVNSSATPVQSGERTHALVVERDNSNLVDSSDCIINQAQIEMETEVIELSTLKNDEQHTDQNSERNSSEISSSSLWTVPSCSLTEKDDDTEMLFIPTPTGLSSNTGLASTLLLSPQDETKNRKLMQLACIAQELQSAKQPAEMEHEIVHLTDSTVSGSVSIEQQDQNITSSSSSLSAEVSDTPENLSRTNCSNRNETSDVEISEISAHEPYLKTITPVADYNFPIYSSQSVEEVIDSDMSVIHVTSSSDFSNINPVEEVVELVEDNLPVNDAELESMETEPCMLSEAEIGNNSVGKACSIDESNIMQSESETANEVIFTYITHSSENETMQDNGCEDTEVIDISNEESNFVVIVDETSSASEISQSGNLNIENSVNNKNFEDQVPGIDTNDSVSKNEIGENIIDLSDSSECAMAEETFVHNVEAVDSVEVKSRINEEIEVSNQDSKDSVPGQLENISTNLADTNIRLHLSPEPGEENDLIIDEVSVENKDSPSQLTLVASDIFPEREASKKYDIDQNFPQNESNSDKAEENMCENVANDLHSKINAQTNDQEINISLHKTPESLEKHGDLDSEISQKKKPAVSRGRKKSRFSKRKYSKTRDTQKFAREQKNLRSNSGDKNKDDELSSLPSILDSNENHAIDPEKDVSTKKDPISTVSEVENIVGNGQKNISELSDSAQEKNKLISKSPSLTLISVLPNNESNDQSSSENVDSLYTEHHSDAGKLHKDISNKTSDDSCMKLADLPLDSTQDMSEKSVENSFNSVSNFVLEQTLTERENEQNVIEESNMFYEDESLPVNAEESLPVDSEENPQVDAEENPQVDAEENPQVDAEENPQVDAEESQQVDAESQQVDAEESQQVEAEESQQVEAEESQQVEAEESQQVDAEESQQVDAEENQQVDAMESEQIDIEVNLKSYEIEESAEPNMLKENMGAKMLEDNDNVDITSKGKKSDNKNNSTEQNSISTNLPSGSGKQKVTDTSKAIDSEGHSVDSSITEIVNIAEETIIEPPKKTYTRKRKSRSLGNNLPHVNCFEVDKDTSNADKEIELFSCEELGTSDYNDELNGFPADALVSENRPMPGSSDMYGNEVAFMSNLEGRVSTTYKRRKIVADEDKKTQCLRIQPRTSKRNSLPVRETTKRGNKSPHVRNKKQKVSDEVNKSLSVKDGVTESPTVTSVEMPESYNSTKLQSRTPVSPTEKNLETENTTSSINKRGRPKGTQNKVKSLISWEKLVKSSPGKKRYSSFLSSIRRKHARVASTQLLSPTVPSPSDLFKTPRKRGRPRKDLNPAFSDPTHLLLAQQEMLGIDTPTEIKKLNIQVRLQKSEPPDKVNSYSCLNCKFITTRLNNLLMHYRLVCFHDSNPLDMFHMGKEDMDRRQRIRGEEPDEIPGSVDTHQLSMKTESNGIVQNLFGENSETQDEEKHPGVYSDLEADDDLPISEIRPKIKFEFAEDDVVWVEWKRIYWPSLIRFIFPKEKRISVLFIDSPSTKKGLKVSVKKVQTFNNAEMNKRFLSEGKASQFGETFVKAVQKAEEFVRKRCLGVKISASKFFENLNEDSVEYMSDVEPSSSATFQSETNEVSSDSNVPISENLSMKVTKNSASSNEAETRSTEPLNPKKNLGSEVLSNIKKGEYDEYLVRIYENTVPSERHRKFFSDDPAEKNHLKAQAWFGPIQDNDEQGEIFDYFYDLFKIRCEFDEAHYIVGYIYEVWIPDAVVKAISCIKGISLDEAEVLFENAELRT